MTFQQQIMQLDYTPMPGSKRPLEHKKGFIEARNAAAALAKFADDTTQPRLTVRLTSFPESNGKCNWTALLVRVNAWGGLVGNCGGITVDRGEFWNRVAYKAERAKLLIGERDTEPNILDYSDDIRTPEEWGGEVRGGRYVRPNALVDT